MRIKPDQLTTHVEGSLKPVYLITGEEPLLVQEAMDEIRSAARAKGFDERQVLQVERGFDWQALLEESNSLSLFASQKIIELKLPSGKPGTEGSKKLAEYLQSPPEDTVLIIEAGRIDKKTLEKSKWCSSIDRLGAIIQIWPIKPNEMPSFMRQRARKLKLNIQHDALLHLSSRLEGNLLAAKQELDKLKLLHGTEEITTGMILDEVKDSARYDVFDLCKATMQGNAAASANILHHLRAEGTEATYVLWALGKDIRLLAELTLANGQPHQIEQTFKNKRLFPQQQKDYRAALANHVSNKDCNHAITLLKQADDAIKGAKHAVNPWQLIEEAVFTICKVDLHISSSA